MATDFVHFLLILYLIYVSDCFAFARTSEWLLYVPLKGMKWRVKSAESAIAMGGRYWLLRPLGVPLGSSFRLHFSRCSLGFRGLCSVSPLANSARMGGVVRYLDYDAVTSVEIREHVFWVNGEAWFTGSRAELTAARAALKSVMAADDRAGAVQSWIRSLYETGLQADQSIGELDVHTGMLNLCCSVYAIWLLLFVPLALFLFPPARLLWNVAVPLLLLHLACGGLFLRAHAKLLSRERYDRWETFFKLFLCPPMMIRACDPICDQVGIQGDPVAVLLSCCSRKRVWRPVVQQVWRRLIPGERSSWAPEVADAMNEYVSAYRTVMEEVLTEQGIQVREFDLAVPALADGQRICPCCETIYRSGITVCSDCGDVPLLDGRNDHVS
jgi:hypothetical protein